MTEYDHRIPTNSTHQLTTAKQNNPLNTSISSKPSSRGSMRFATLAALTILGGLGTVGCSDSSATTTSSSITQSALSLKDGIPKSMKYDEIMFSIGTDLNLMVDGVKFGKIDEEVLSWGRKFVLYGADGEVIATAKQRKLSWGVKIDVYDAEGEQLGTVEEKVFDSMFSIKSKYSIKDASGAEVANSEKLDFLGSSITIDDLDGNTVAEMSKPAINLMGDNWTAEFSGDVDRRLLVFIPAYKSAADNAK